MADINRKVQELLVDYADALRDGSLPVFLKSLTREEGQRIGSSRDFWDAAEIARVLNGVGFADKALTPNVGLFISRVDAEIASRLKRAKAPSRAKRGANQRGATKTKKTEKPI
ncbi:MAG TPA: hypothetical protein VMW16_08025 [Sedimentisphaerales bacterium]|nr:hypothetical protein [Sedimentisphaerales bacterium]